MAVYISLPKLGINMTKGTIVDWLVKEGEAVKTGQPILSVETDKAVQEIEAPASGILAKVLRHENEEVPCLTVLGVITQPGEPLPPEIPDVIADGVPPKADVEVTLPAGSGKIEPEPAEQERINISPAARKLAKDLGVDLSQISAKGKRITKEDIEAAYQSQQAAAKSKVSQPQPYSKPPVQVTTELPVSSSAVRETSPEGQVQVKPLTGVRRSIAEHMTLSARTVARVGLTLEVEAGELIAWRERLRNNGHEVGFNELLIKLVAHALEELPYMNCQLVEDAVWVLSDINVGLATDTEGGLVVPVIRKANKKGVLEIHREVKELVARARERRSKLEDFAGGTFTITNLGMYEVEQFFPIINVPQCAILGVGAIVRKPVAVGDRVEVRPRGALTLAFDHRLVDGAPAARFLQRVKSLIENPLELVS